MAKKLDPHKASKALGLKIRALRNEREWTLEDMEEQGWPSWRHLQKIEGGKNITLKTLINLANLFEISPAELLEDL